MKIDYDTLAQQYAQYRKVHPGVLCGLLEISSLNTGSCVLEVGCGTGNYILDIRAAVGCRCWGVEPSDKMLSIAQRRSSDVVFNMGDADNLPYPDSSFDLVFSVDVAHHLDHTQQYIRESARVLKGGGKMCTVTENEALIRARIPLANYFPETVEKELQRYPNIEQMRNEMRSAGLIHLREEVVRLPYEIDEVALFESKAFSALQIIPEQAFQRGLAHMYADLKKGPIQAVSHYLMLWGQKPFELSISAKNRL